MKRMERRLRQLEESLGSDAETADAPCLLARIEAATHRVAAARECGECGPSEKAPKWLSHVFHLIPASTLV